MAWSVVKNDEISLGEKNLYVKDDIESLLVFADI